ncbi:MAG: PAS domain-containing protein, partial [Burkholderiales bacterium]
MMRDLKLAGTRTEEPPPVMLWRARPDLSCEYLSKQWLDFTGCPEEQALGDGWLRGVHPEDLARWLDTCLRAFDAREAFEIEYRLRRRDGEYRWVLDRGRPRFSADGLFLGFAGTCLEIHERKRAEQELARLQERERRLRAATDLSPVGDGPALTGVRVLIVDQDPAARESMARVLD